LESVGSWPNLTAGRRVINGGHAIYSGPMPRPTALRRPAARDRPRPAGTGRPRAAVRSRM